MLCSTIHPDVGFAASMVYTVNSRAKPRFGRTHRIVRRAYRMNASQIAESALPDLDDLLSLSNRLLDNIGLVVLGKPEVIRLAAVSLFAEGHALIEDVPGVGKTLLARAIAASIDCSFRRIQFTPDLLPSDVLGSSVYHAPSGDFVFKPGPLFANVILADEINRTTPRTQSALLERSEEH